MAVSWLGKVTTAAFLGLLIVLAVYIPSSRAYIGHRVFTAENNAPVNVTAAPGESVAIQVKIHEATDGFWASPTGVRLVLPGWSPVTLVPVSEPSWGDKIDVDSPADQPYNGQDIIVGGRFTIPVNAPTAAISGALQGAVIYPQTGLGTFRDITDQLANPVKIAISPRAQSVWGSGPLTAVLEYLGLALAAALAGCILLRLWARVAARRSMGMGTGLGGRRWLALLLCLVVAGGAAYLIGYGVQVFAMASENWASGPAPLPLVPFWVLPVLTGLVGLAAVTTLFVRY